MARHFQPRNRQGQSRHPRSLRYRYRRHWRPTILLRGWKWHQLPVVSILHRFASACPIFADAAKITTIYHVNLGRYHFALGHSLLRISFTAMIVSTARIVSPIIIVLLQRPGPTRLYGRGESFRRSNSTQRPRSLSTARPKHWARRFAFKWLGHLP
jgi:hypothetical protein